jgi:hypothetical protein
MKVYPVRTRAIPADNPLKPATEQQATVRVDRGRVNFAQPPGPSAEQRKRIAERDAQFERGKTLDDFGNLIEDENTVLRVPRKKLLPQSQTEPTVTTTNAG